MVGHQEPVSGQSEQGSAWVAEPAAGRSRNHEGGVFSAMLARTVGVLSNFGRLWADLLDP